MLARFSPPTLPRVDAATARTCSSCGTSADAPPEGLPEGWSLVTEKRRVEYHCATCVRANIRAIEAKLPEEYWEF